MKLTFAQKKHLFDRGYVVLRGIIPRKMVDAALLAINHQLGEGIDMTQVQKLRARSFCPEVADHPAISGLYNQSPARGLMESAMKPGHIEPVTRGQIALRFPTLREPSPPGPHLDGMYTPLNGVKEGTIGNFTGLMGVFLNDVPKRGSGNFIVWPGTHRLMEAYFKEHGPSALLKGFPPVKLPKPVQVIVNAGDVVIAHYLTAHAGSENGAPNIRYAIFFRLSHVDSEAHGTAPMADAWSEWDGIRRAMSAMSAKSH